MYENNSHKTTEKGKHLITNESYSFLNCDVFMFKAIEHSRLMIESISIIDPNDCRKNLDAYMREKINNPSSLKSSHVSIKLICGE